MQGRGSVDGDVPIDAAPPPSDAVTDPATERLGRDATVVITDLALLRQMVAAAEACIREGGTVLVTLRPAQP